MVKQHGGEVSGKATQGVVTHLVTGNPNTSKAAKARFKGMEVVDEAWYKLSNRGLVLIETSGFDRKLEVRVVTAAMATAIALTLASPLYCFLTAGTRMSMGFSAALTTAASYVPECQHGEGSLKVYNIGDHRLIGCRNRVLMDGPFFQMVLISGVRLFIKTPGTVWPVCGECSKPMLFFFQIDMSKMQVTYGH